MRKIKFADVMKLARRAHSMPLLRAVVFDGKSAIAAGSIDWFAGVPCPQDLAAPVVVPVEALQVHLSKSRHLIVTPDGLTNGQGLVTRFERGGKGFLFEELLGLLPSMPAPEVERLDFALELDALDRVLVAAAEHDIRYYLNGVLMNLSRGDLVGTDGHRLHCYRNRVPTGFKRPVVDGMPQGHEVQVILPSEPLDWIVGSESEAATVTVWNPCRNTEGFAPVPALLQAGDGFVFCRNAIEGKYPEYERVIPAAYLGGTVAATLDPVALADAAGAMARAFAVRHGSKFSPAGLDFGAGRVYAGTDADFVPVPMDLKLKTGTGDLESARDDLWATFHAAYVQDVADCVTRAAEWRFPLVDAATHALVVYEGDFVGVVMPTRDSRPGLAARMPQDAPEPAQDAPEVPEPAQDAPEVPEPAQDAPEVPEPAQDAPEVPEPAQDAPEVPEPAQDAPEVPEPAQDAPEGPETAQDAPCPAAVASLAAQLVRDAQTGRKTHRKAGKARKAAKSEPVPA